VCKVVPRQVEYEVCRMVPVTVCPTQQCSTCAPTTSVMSTSPIVPVSSESVSEQADTSQTLHRQMESVEQRTLKPVPERQPQVQRRRTAPTPSIQDIPSA